MTYRIRRSLLLIVALISFIVVLINAPDLWQTQTSSPATKTGNPTGQAAEALVKLPVKGRAPKTGYARTQFGDGWAITRGCDTRNIILNRDMTGVRVENGCKVAGGSLQDPYTGKQINFTRGPSTSADIQIDHVVALGNAWQTGAQQLTADERKQLANDPLELLAVDGPANQQKSDGDAATWLPPNKAFRCQYVARQIAVKQKYRLWVTGPERDAIARILAACHGQALPTA